MIHFVNCAVLTFAPYWVLYKSSKLSEYRALQVILFAGLGFALTQVAELISMALLLPGKTDAPGFHLGQELGELLVHFLEPIGVHLTLNKIPRLSQYPADLRVVAVAIGWSCAQSLALFLFPLWFGARGMEFSWDYIQMGLTANVQLVYCSLGSFSFFFICECSFSIWHLSHLSGFGPVATWKTALRARALLSEQ